MRNRRIAYLICMFSIIAGTSEAQNRIRNAGFEERHHSSPSSHPNDVGQVEDETRVWKSQLECYPADGVVSGEWENCGGKLHSPDWWSNDAGPGPDNLKFPYRVPIGSGPTSTYQAVPAHTGNHFVGMGPGELIQQQLPDEFELEPGQTYYFILRVRLFEYGQYVNPLSPSYNDVSLKVLLAAAKITYDSDDPNDLGTSEYWEKDNPLEQDIVTVGSINLSLTEFPYGEWHEVIIEFVAPEDYTLVNISHDWVAFEVQGSGIPYIGIDNISLMNCSPTESCSPTYGDISPSFSGSHYSTEPWRIDGINSATKLDFEIWPMLGGDIAEFSVECEWGFPNGWRWSGQSAGGSEFAAGTYVYHMTAQNECGSTTFNGTFVKSNGHNNPTDVNPLFFGCGGVTYVPPKPCCPYEPIMYLDGHHWVGQNLTFQAISEIIVASSSPVIVGEESSVIMRAGERIELNPGFSTQGHELFVAEIVPCPSLRLSGEVQDSYADSIESIDNPSIPSSENPVSQPVLYPNPTTGLLSLNHPKQILHLEVFDSMGRLIQQTMPNANTATIDLSGNAAGIYTVRATLEDGRTETHRAVLSPQ